MPIRKEDCLDYKLSSIEDGELVFLSDYPEYDNASVCRVLADKCTKGEFIKIAQGIYCKAKMTRFGPLLPSIDDIIKAISRRDMAKILPSGETAMNKLGLSEQVPLKQVYLTSGSAREINIDGITIKLKRSVPKTFEFKGTFYALLAQALKAIGKDNLTEEQEAVISRLLKNDPEPEVKEHDIRLMPVWMQKTIKRLAEKI